MNTRQVTHAIRNRKGNLVALCQPSAPWSPIEKGDAIDEIEHRRNRYYVKAGNLMAEILVVKGSHGKYLRSKADRTHVDNLKNLHGCWIGTWPRKACSGPC